MSTAITRAMAQQAVQGEILDALKNSEEWLRKHIAAMREAKLRMALGQTTIYVRHSTAEKTLEAHYAQLASSLKYYLGNVRRDRRKLRQFNATLRAQSRRTRT